jgi:uncharacterized membrane-anchored protein
MLLRVLLLTALIAPAFGADPAPDARQQAMHQAASAAKAALVKGPAEVTLRDQAKLALPENFGFVPQQQAAALMRAMGNTTGDDFLGLIIPHGGDSHWFVAVSYEASGYIKDDDARNWDADKLLQSLKEGTEAANEERAKAGVPALEVTRWIEPPAYEPATHRLVWSAEARHKDGSSRDPTVNYNTYLLGREGYVSMNLITSASAVDADKSAARALLAAVDFDSGKQYGDFNSSTDKVAAYGLAALVAGVAAKKLGLLALLAAMAVKFAKIIAVSVAALIVAIKRWLKGRSAPAA